MSIYIMGLVVYFYILGVLGFSLKRKHLLLMLLSLEFILISLYLGLIVVLSYYGYEYFIGMVFLTIGVCEGALGLSILVSLIRSHGNDYVRAFSVVW